MGCGRIRLGQNGKESVLPKRYGKNEKMSVLPKEMWSAWENVCGKKRDVVRMGKCLCGKREMRSEWESVCVTNRCGQYGKIGCEEKGMQYKDKCVCGRKRVWDGVGDVQEHRFCVRMWV